MDLYIGDPENPPNDKGQHFVLKFEIPRSTRRVFIRSDPKPRTWTRTLDTFTVVCELKQESENWDFSKVESSNQNVETISFEKGERMSFFEKGNEREEMWKKYGVPIMKAGAKQA